MINNLSQDTIFKELKFTKEWIEAGIVNIENFSQIKEKYLEGKDNRTEHYRWWAFTNFIQKNKTISKNTFYQIYDLGQKDSDYAMGRAMRFDIIKRLDCPKELIDITVKDKDKSLSNKALRIAKDLDIS